MVQNKTVKGILFDMDGVIIDSEEFMRDAAIQMFREKGQEVKPEDFSPFIGAGENRYIGGVAEKYQVELDIEEAKSRAYDIYYERIKNNIRPLPGTRKIITTCHKEGLKTALVTSADTIKVKYNLEALQLDESSFHVYVTGNDVDTPKPDPAIFIKAAEMLELETNECLVIEDSLNGIKAAKRAGCICIALTTSFDEQDLKEADYIYPDLSAIPENLLRS